MAIVRLTVQRTTAGKPPVPTYTLDVEPERVTLLDALLQVQQEQDGSLALRYNCRNVICGSCALTVNGRPALACQKTLAAWLVPGSDTLYIAPLPNLPVIRDLVVNLENFWQGLIRVQPTVQGGSDRQLPAQRDRLQAAANCLLCGACYGACNRVSARPGGFVGPHALAKAQRLLQDNRDTAGDRRRQEYNQVDFGWGCTRCYRCNEVCPVGVQPLDRITEVKQEVLATPNLPDSTALRHRRTLVDMVATAGWIDESRFAAQVVGWRGWWSLLPLGLKMLQRRKLPLPWHFRPSAGKAAIARLMAPWRSTH
ncbi:MAG: succinate dehydrogenase/fumarate reductase iron-sulfur subunit [Pseudanabaenaceae cyanobacterium]